ncbi:MAG TPA: hypothetical protein VHM25_01560 [Polyangiaceae bacterium]|jgi:hypothetical protein|nr:hypothetical protein [Polyangiaceae bacterium]
MQLSDEGDDGHIPTQPFGTKAVVTSQAAPKDSRRGRDSGARFRFLVPTLPTSLSQENEPPTAALSWQRAGSPRASTPDRLQPPSRIRLPLLLGAGGVAILALLLLFWPDDALAPARSSPPRSAPSVLQRAPHGTPESVAARTLPIAESPTAGLARAGTAAVPQSSSQPKTLPSPEPNAATHPASPTSPRATVSKALPTLKGESVLASVLAPPPAD